MATTIRTLRRRDLIAAFGCAGAALSGMPALAQQRTIRIGCSFDNSGVEMQNGSGNFRGATAFFNALNKRGGIGGAKVELVVSDDQFKPDLAKANAQAFDADKSIVAMLAPLGTRQTAAIMDTVKDMAIVGPNTGTAGLRKTSPPNLFWVRASYDAEVDRLIHTALTLSIDRIGIVHPDDPLGKSVFAGFERAMAAAGLKPVVVAKTPGTTSPQVEQAVADIVKAAPQMVIVALAGVVPTFVKALRSAGGRSALYGLSIGASAANIENLGELGRGMGFALIVPSPFAPKHDIVRRYQADMAESGWTDFSLPTLEGYVNARVLAEGLRNAGPGVTRESLISGLERIGTLDLGGMRIGYGHEVRTGSNFVDVAVVGAGNRLLS